MRVFTHKGRKYVNINGKDYYAIRLYGSAGYDGAVSDVYFGQVAGLTPLKAEDLPDKDFELVRKKMKAGRVWTFWRRDFHKFESEAQKAKWLFVGATTSASWFLALTQLVRVHRLGGEITEDMIRERAALFSAGQLSKYDFGFNAVDVLEDLGNGGAKAVLIHFDPASHKCRDDHVRRVFEQQPDPEPETEEADGG
jgi:hypothetical protein